MRTLEGPKTKLEISEWQVERGGGEACRPLTTSWSGEVGVGVVGVDWKGRSRLQLPGNPGNYRTQKKSLTFNRFLALPYGLGSLYMVNHCNRKKGPAQIK